MACGVFASRICCYNLSFFVVAICLRWTQLDSILSMYALSFQNFLREVELGGALKFSNWVLVSVIGLLSNI